MIDELERIWKEAVVAYRGTIPAFAEGTEKNRERFSQVEIPNERLSNRSL
jgi:hypothetical protein